MPTRVMLMGLGPIGAGVARQLIARRNFKLVAAVDIDPAKVGKDLADIVDLAKPTRIKVGPDPVAAIRRTKPQVAVLCTSSSLKQVWPQIETVLKRRGSPRSRPPPPWPSSRWRRSCGPAPWGRCASCSR